MALAYTCGDCGWHRFPGDGTCPGCRLKEEKREADDSSPGSLSFYPKNESQAREHKRIQRKRARRGAYG